MAETSAFYRQCEALFVDKLGYGRRWKTAAAQALGIGRATLYRYFENDDAVAPDVLAKLVELSGEKEAVHGDGEMVALIATGLLDLQDEIDTRGWLKTGYPNALQRVFDLASARNIADGQTRWPVDMASLAVIAQRPLFEWVPDLSWDPAGDYTDAVLLETGEITSACADLAAAGKDSETELVERSGFGLLKKICLDRPDGQAIYVAFRRAVIDHPILTNWAVTVLADPVLASVDGIEDVVEAFYQRLPEALTVNGEIPVCKISGTVLRRQRNGFHTECRDPEAVRLAKAGDHDTIAWSPRAKQLRRAFRMYWCLPGLSEIILFERLKSAGWVCSLWPKLDRVDLAATSPDGQRRIAIDVKDYLSPSTLAVRFDGFKDFEPDHNCYLVIPDYLTDLSPGYARAFKTVRKSYTKTKVLLRTVSGLLTELGVAA